MKFAMMSILLFSTQVFSGQKKVNLQKLNLNKNSIQSMPQKIQGNWGSGGGNVIVCFDNKESFIRTKNNKFVSSVDLDAIKSIEMYDLHAAKRVRNFPSGERNTIVPYKEESEIEYVIKILMRDHRVANYHQVLLEKYDYYLNSSSFKLIDEPVKQISDINDVTHMEKENCTISTMAAQTKFNDFFEIFIDARLYFHPKHSKLSRAVLLLHEIIYTIGRGSFEHKDSQATRGIVGRLISYNSNYSVKNYIIDMHRLLKGDKGINTPEYKVFGHSNLHSFLKIRFDGLFFMLSFLWKNHEQEKENDFIRKSLEILNYIYKKHKLPLLDDIYFFTSISFYVRQLMSQDLSGDIKLSSYQRELLYKLGNKYDELEEEKEKRLEESIDRNMEVLFDMKGIKEYVNLSQNDEDNIITLKKYIKQFMTQTAIGRIGNFVGKKYFEADLDIIANTTLPEENDPFKDYWESFISLEEYIYISFTSMSGIIYVGGDEDDDQELGIIKFQLDQPFPMPTKYVEPGKEFKTLNITQSINF